MVHTLKNRRGQTMVEYLLLMAAAFITGYIVVTGPLARFTTSMLGKIRGTVQNIVQTAEMSNSGKSPGQPGHPSRRERHKALHF